MTGHIVAAAFLAGGFLVAAIVGRAGRAAWQAYEEICPWPAESDGVYDWELEPDPERWTHDLPGRLS